MRPSNAPKLASKPRLLLATPYYAPKVGGLENYAHRIAQELMARGWDVAAVATNHQAQTYSVEEVDGVRVHRLPATFRLSNTSVGLSWARHIRRIIAQERPDIINAHTPVPGVADASARAAGSTPFVLTYHAATLYKQDDKLFNALIRGYRLIERLMLQKTQRIITVTPYHKDRVSARTRRKFHLIENAIPPAELLQHPPAKKPHHLVFINNLAKAHAWKGLDQILQAIAIYAASSQPVHLDIIGGGDYLEYYQQLAQELGIARHVTFHGQQVAEGKYGPLQAASALLCYPTAANDAFPTVILEAWAHFTPVIAADIGALPHIVNDGQDGVLVPPHNPKALATAIGALLDNADLRQRLARAGYQRATAQTWTIQGAKTDKLFRELIG